MPTLEPQGTYSKLLGTPFGNPLSTFALGTGIALDNYTHFLPLELRVYVTDSFTTESKWVVLPLDDWFLKEWWKKGSFALCANAHGMMCGGCGIDYDKEPIAQGLLLDTSTTYDINDIVPLKPNESVSSLFMLMRMYG